MCSFIFVVFLAMITGTVSGEALTPEINIEQVGHFDEVEYVEKVFVSGNYAYLVIDNGFLIIDISNPSSPIPKGKFNIEWVSDISISGNYAYVAANDDGLLVVNISNPSSPTLVGKYDTVGSAESVSVSGNYAYVDDGPNGIVVIDISDPSLPTLLTPEENNALPPGDILVYSDYAYIAYGDLMITDISNPSSPSYLGHVEMPECGVVDMEHSGNYIYAVGDGLVIIDVSNPSSPTIAGKYDFFNGGEESLSVSENYAYITPHGNSGSGDLLIINVSNPYSPTFVGSYETVGWSVDVNVSGNYVYVADGHNGLIILKTDIQNQVLPEGSLVQVEGNSDVYLIENSMKRHFTSPEALLWNGYSFDEVINVTSETLQSYPDGEDISISQAIIDKYHALGGEPIFGAPAGTGELKGDSDSAGTYCSYVNFENGAIECFQEGDRKGEAYAIFNPLLTKWASMGYGKSVLGYPIDNMSNEETSKFGTKFRYQNFANGTEKGALEYNLTSGDVFEVHGAIFAKWGSIGYANSELGLSTSDERDAVPSFKGTTGRVNDFENGHLHWHGSGDHYMNTYMTYGDLDKFYINMGGTASDLGFPITDQETKADGHDYCEFEGGSIGWDDSTGTYKVNNPVSNTPPTTNPVSVTNTESLTPTISWTYYDVEGNPQQQYELEVCTGPWGTGTKMWSQSQSSMYTSVDYGGDTLTSGETYYVRVRAFDRTDWSEWSETIIQIAFEPTPTKKVAVVLAKFNDSNTITSPDIETVKKRCELIQQYYHNQSYGAEHIDFDFYTTGTGDGWYEISETTESGIAKLQLKEGNFGNNEAMWENACNVAGLEIVGYREDTKTPILKDYDVALVLIPADFRSYSWVDSSASVCSAIKGYGNWAHELGHSLYGLKDKAGDEIKEGNIGNWGIMGMGYQYNPPAPIIGFEKNQTTKGTRVKTSWLSYKDITSSDITDLGNEYTISYLDDLALHDEGLLRLNTKVSTKFIFEARRKTDGVAKESSKENNPLFDSAGKGIVIYNVDSSNKIFRETSPRAVSDLWYPSYTNRVNNDVTISSGESKYLDSYTWKATCLSAGDKVKLKIEPVFPKNYNVWSIAVTTADSLYDSLLSVPDNSNPDVDLHVITSDGRRVGMDYANGTYYNEIDGAETSGNLLGGGPEWIAIPDGIDATAYVTISPDMKTLLLDNDSSNVNVSSTLMVYDENGNMEKSEHFSINISSKNMADQFTIPLIKIDSLPSITNLQSTNGTFWINWTWTNPMDTDFNHTEIYIDGIFQTNTSAEYFNATDLEPEKEYTISTRTVDISGNVNETWVNSTVTTLAELASDTEKPVIQSVVLYPANTTTGSTINVTVTATDNIDVTGVTADDIQLIKTDGIWQGSITAPSSVGDYSLLITAKDATGNTAETTTNYKVVTPTGSLGVGISPKTTTAPTSGKTIDYTVKIKSIQNFDDIVRVNVTMDGLPASYQISSDWFEWNNQTINIPSNSTVSLPLKLTIPPGQAAGRKAFKVRANSTLWITSAYDSGVITIS